MPVTKAKLKKVEQAPAKAPEGLTMGAITAPEFQQALTTLMNQPLNVKASVALIKAHEEVANLHKTYEKIRIALLVKYGELNEKGEVKMNEEKTKYLLRDAAGFDKEFRELLLVPVELTKVPLSYVDDAKLPPAMLSSLMRTVLNPET